MGWHLKASEKMGKSDQTRREWVEQLEADGHDVSGLLDEEPELFDDLTPYWIAFHTLSSSRSVGMGIGAIPLPAYESYFRIMGIDSLEEQINYIKFVGVLDDAYLKWNGEQHEKERKKSESKNKSKSKPAPRKR